MTYAHSGGDAAGASELQTPRAVSTPGSASVCCFATGRHNTGDKLRASIACAALVSFIPLFGGAEIDHLDGSKVVAIESSHAAS
jgi:hypothetical protein